MFDLIIFDCGGELIGCAIILAQMLIAELALNGVGIDPDDVAAPRRPPVAPSQTCDGLSRKSPAKQDGYNLTLRTGLGMIARRQAG